MSSSQRTLKITVKSLAPLEFKVFSVLVILATNYKILTGTFNEVSPWTFAICNFIAIAVWTAKQVVVIDFQERTIGEGSTILGMNFLSKNSYSGFEKIFINSVATGETFRHLTRNIRIHHNGFKAFLKTNEGDKYCIAVESDKERLIKKTLQYNLAIMTQIVDNTTPE